MLKLFICNLISLLFQLLKKRRIVSLVSFFLKFLLLLAWLWPECLLLKWAWYWGFGLLVPGLRRLRLCGHGLHGWGWLKFNIWVWPVCLFLKWAWYRVCGLLGLDMRGLRLSGRGLWVYCLSGCGLLGSGLGGLRLWWCGLHGQSWPLLK